MLELLVTLDFRVIPDLRVHLVRQVCRVTLDRRVELVRQVLLVVSVRLEVLEQLVYQVIRDLAVVLDCRVYLDQLAQACLDPAERPVPKERLVSTCAA